MSMPVERPARLYEQVWRSWLDAETFGLRQMPITVLVPLTILVLDATVEPASPALLGLSVALVVAVQLAGSLGRWDRWPAGGRYVLPALQIVAIGLLDLGAGQPIVGIDILLFVPVTGLALRPGVAGLAVALSGSALVLFAPVVWDIGRVRPLLHAVITLIIITIVALLAHSIVAMVRLQAQALEAARDALAVQARQLADSRDILNSIVQAATQQAIIGTDRHGVLLTANTGAERIFGRPATELLGLEVSELVAPDALGARLAQAPDRHEPEAAARLVIGEAAAGGTQVEEWPVLLPDGTRRLLELVITRRPALEGAAPELPPGYLVVATDVTARHEEERLQDEFIGLVSHELRTPLWSILGYLDLLRLDSDELTEDQRGYLEVVERNANRLRTLVDELLASAQLVLGASLTPEPLDLVDVVRQEVANQLPLAQADEVRLETDGDPVVLLRSDAQRLGQVVDNLLTNAIKYSRPGGRVVVTVNGETAADGTRTARIRVADHGVGIAPDELARLTERFYRTRDTRRRRVRGAGIGLSLVQAIVDEHHGTLSIDSELGVGTEVEVVLPDLDPSPEPGSPPSREPDSPTGTGTTVGPA